MVLPEALKETEKEMTAANLLHLPEGQKKYELIRGELIEMSPPGGTHGYIAAEISRLLKNFVNDRELGVVLVETGFQLTVGPDTVRAPDISFVAGKNLPPEGLPDGYLSGAPDLAVEIVSPGDTASAVQEKVQEYLASGARLVWVVYPQQRIVVVHHPDGTARTLNETDTLAGEAVVPGFECSVKDMFS